MAGMGTLNKRIGIILLITLVVSLWAAWPVIAAPHFGCIPPHSGNCLGHPGTDVVPYVFFTTPCSAAEVNGWCPGTQSLHLTATDPQGYAVQINGSLQGNAFVCPWATGTVSCSIPLPEGSGMVAFTATSDHGLSTSGSTDWARDATPPLLSASLSGATGQNGWYQAATLSASGSDALSGLIAYEYSLDGGAWTVFPGTYPVPDGKHTLDVRVSDLAGNLTQAEQTTVWVDSVQPELSVDLSGTGGKNGWYTSDVQVTALGSDPSTGSGLVKLEYALDGGGWTSYSAPLALADGTHSLSFYAEDAAGQSRQVDQVVKVDTVAPLLGGSLKGTLGQNGWYISNATLTASAADPTSGLTAFTYTLDGGAPSVYSAPLTLTDGQHTLVLTAEDAAGLQASTIQTVKVDTQAPSLQALSALPAWVNRTASLNGSAGDLTSGLSKVEISTDNGASWRQAATPSAWSHVWDSSVSGDGAHTVRIRALDLAGLISEIAFQAQVDNSGPQISAPEAWNAWSAAKLNASDEGSGVAEIRVEIFDPENRWPRRRLDLDAGDLPLEFRWDLRFADGTLAPAGDFEVLVTALDNLGNVSHKTARINFPWAASLLPAPAMATALPTPHATATALALVPLPTAQALAPLNTEEATSFGAPESLWPVSSGDTQTKASTPPVHDVPLTTAITSWIGSIVNPAPTSAPLGDLGSNVLWGGAAAAALAAFNVLIEQKKREQEAQAAAERAERKGDGTRASLREAQKEKSDPGYAQARSLASAIAAVKEQEEKEWKTER